MADDLEIERIPYDHASWEATISRYQQAEVYHTPPWLDFLAISQSADPVIGAVVRGSTVVGHFVGGVVRRFGVRILGSPLTGWNTQCMGFLLEDGVDHRAAASALVNFAFRDLRCSHIELGDRQLTTGQMLDSGYSASSGISRVVDLRPTESQIIAQMRSTTRNYIRQSAKKGLIAEIVRDPGFADEYYAQLCEVFQRQGLTPTYGPGRVRQLIAALATHERMLAIRVRSPTGASIATAISVGFGSRAVLWGTASVSDKMGWHPNELVHWETIRYWKARGITEYDLGGGGEYKAKYGGTEVPTARFRRFRYPLMGHGRSLVRRAVKLKQRTSAVARRIQANGGG